MAEPPVPGSLKVRIKPAEAYHHGDLRTALIAEAREALKTRPPEAIALKALAERLGVSQPAPYRHFSGREALMAAVAADGFQRFEASLRAAAAAAPASRRFESACAAYLAFARENPGVYRLMFASRLLSAVEPDAEVAHQASSAFGFLLRSVAGEGQIEDAWPTAVALWSALHGMAMLDAEGLLRGPDVAGRAPAVRTELLRELVRRFDPHAAPDDPSSPAE